MRINLLLAIKNRIVILVLFLVSLLFSLACNTDNNTSEKCSKFEYTVEKLEILKRDTVIVDADYSFDEAIKGTKAPQSVIDQLVLVDVYYYSMDNKIHKGQMLTNKKIVADIAHVFKFILESKFPVQQVVPVVRFNWDDNTSMQANNSYSFCYRNISYSKHASGMAIDINPLLNPMRYKDNRKNNILPAGAVYNPAVPGTFYENHPVVLKFEELGFKWGHVFKKSFDDHHFEKKPY